MGGIDFAKNREVPKKEMGSWKGRNEGFIDARRAYRLRRRE
jgi:hypothetical protein